VAGSGAWYPDTVNRLLDTLRALRAPDGCPWDREQTHESLRPYLLEEAAEAVDALASGDLDAVIEELGDVLLHVGMHAVIAEEDGAWDFAEVESRLVEKLVRRHPHVFAGEEVADAAAVEETWARVKASEHGGRVPHPVERVPRSLPALARAAALAQALDWQQAPGALERVANGDDEPEALAQALLALAIRVARAGGEPELLLRDAIAARAESGAAEDAHP